MSAAPAAAARASRPGASSSPSRAHRSTATIGPVSRPASIRITVTPGLAVAGQDRGRDRRRAAPARQQRRMDVEDAGGGQVEDRRGHDPAVVGQDAEAGTERRDLRDGLGAAQASPAAAPRGRAPARGPPRASAAARHAGRRAGRGR